MRDEVKFNERDQKALAKYYRWRGKRAGSVKSEAKAMACHTAWQLTVRRLRAMARKYPELAGEIESYLMAGEQERSLRRLAILEKINECETRKSDG
jgi:hypothetical protein